MQVLDHTGPQQFVVVDFEKVIHDKPNGLLCGHPLQMIETAQVYRARESAHGSLAPEIEIQIEVTHGQFAQRTIDRFAIAAAREV